MPGDPRYSSIWEDRLAAEDQMDGGVGPIKMSEQYGAELTVPEGLLEVRHAKILRPAQLEAPALRELVAAASKHLLGLAPA